MSLLVSVRVDFFSRGWQTFAGITFASSGLLAKGPCKYLKKYKNQKMFGYDTTHPPTPLSKKKKFRKISKEINHEYLYIEARTNA